MIKGYFLYHSSALHGNAATRKIFVSVSSLSKDTRCDIYVFWIEDKITFWERHCIAKPYIVIIYYKWLNQLHALVYTHIVS